MSHSPVRSTAGGARTKSWPRLLLVFLGILLVPYGLVVSLTMIGNLYARSSQITDAAPSDQFSDHTTVKIIARVLHAQPLIIDILDKEHLSGSFLDDFGVRSNLFVHRSEQSKLSTLNFNDIISASMYYFPGGGELVIKTAITDIQKLQAPISYFNASSNNPSRRGVAIEYKPPTSSDNDLLIIYNDGTVFYHDKDANMFTDVRLDQGQLDTLLATADATFHVYPSDYRPSSHSSFLMVAHKGYYGIELDTWLPLFEPLASELDRTIQEIQR